MAKITSEMEAQLEEILRPPLIAVVATVGSDGMPQLTPNGYVYKDGRLLVSTTKDRVKYRNLSQNNQLAICICSEPLAASFYVALTGRAEIRDDESIWPDTRDIVKRYVEADSVEARTADLKTQDRVIISLAPERAVIRT